jgi:plastocyanin
MQWSVTASVVVLLLAGCATTRVADLPPNTVVIEGFAYVPPEITVALGTEVTWKNNQIIPHTVTARDRTFDSGSLGSGGTFKRKFDRAGTAEYSCAFHPNMVGKVVVR